MSSLSKSNLLKAVGALLLTVGSLALLVPVLTVSAKRDLPGAQQDGIVAPMRPIQPVSVATVNFKKLAEAEANNKAMGIKEKTEPIAIDPPLSIPEPQEPGTKEAKAQAPQAEGGGLPLIPSPGPSANFQAEEDAAVTIPPDTTGAVGPDKIFVTLNGRYRIQNKTTGAA